MTPIQVAISGKMRSGKDTLAQELSRQTGAPIDRFAAPLKEGCEKFGCGDGEIVKDRQVLQDIGQYFVNRDPRWWVNLMDTRNPERRRTGLILPDLRSRAELDWCKENGILTVRLEVDDEIRIARGAEPDRLDHPTETWLDDALDEFDVVLYGVLPLHLVVETIFKSLKNERIISFGT